MTDKALHKALMNPDTYPDWEQGPIAFRETHVSRLYLTPQYVYKVKKNVDFGFLNFTTLDRRRFYCREEVRLNRRLSPDTYLGVLEIRRQGARIGVEGPGEVIDYAVFMKRLPEERMLDRLLEKPVSLEPAMERVGERLAEFHRQAPVCRHDGGRTNLEVVQRNWNENFVQTEPAVGELLDRATLDHCTAFVERFLAENQSLLLERERNGLVREGHGDLHAEHICLTEPLRIYDCIEFSRRFRVADVLADLAFLLMDLDFRNRRDLAGRVLETYRRSWPDAGGELDRLLPFYQIYRAWVRGKVETFLARDEEASRKTRQQARSRARRHFNLCLGYLCPAPLILTCGLTGTGKTTLARGLAAALGARLLRSDRIRKDLAGCRRQSGNEGFGEGIYTPEFTRRTYERLLEETTQVAGAGGPVIADASFARRRDRERFLRAAAEAGVPGVIVHLQCSRHLALQRLDRRQASGEDISDGRREIYDRQASAFEPPEKDESVITVDSSADVDYNVEFILNRILQHAGMSR